MDEYGKYEKTEDGYILTGIDPDDEREEYVLMPGTTAIAEDAFADGSMLKKITIPASLKTIPEGTLSNGGGWASDHKGIEEITIDKDNPYFVQEGDCFCSVLPDGSSEVLRITGKNSYICIPENVSAVGKGAFLDRTIGEVYLEKYDIHIFFPVSHGFYLRQLLENFGKNGKLYDFTAYDSFLLKEHFNPERIRMICSRIEHPFDMSSDTLFKLKDYLSGSFDEVMEACISKGDEKTLMQLAEAGFFTEDNIGNAVEQANESDRRDLLSWLLVYKNDHFKKEEFDFSI